jgi:prepilin-type N-terminal cleavage/methylation domain-containing protein
MGSQIKEKKETPNGFSLVETVATVSIIGILSSIAIPNYISSLHSGRQKEAELTIATLQTAAMAFVEEYGRTPKGWDDIDKIQPFETKNGAASGESFSTVTLMSGNYKIEGSMNNTNGIVSFEGSPVSTATSIKKRNIIGCINTRSGLSSLKLGSKETEATAQNTDCE